MRAQSAGAGLGALRVRAFQNRMAIGNRHCYFIVSMNDTSSNIEAVARDICERRLLRVGTPPGEVPSAVDRYWHCIAAEIEAGIIDESDNALRPSDFERDLEAYRDWRRRHPAYRVPQLRGGTDRH